MVFIHSVVSDSLWPHGLQSARLLCPWDFLGNNTGVSCHFLLQGIFPTQGSNPSLLHWQADSLSLHHLGSLPIPRVWPKVRGKIYNNQQGRHHLTIDSWKGSNFSCACNQLPSLPWGCLPSHLDSYCPLDLDIHSEPTLHAFQFFLRKLYSLEFLNLGSPQIWYLWVRRDS